MADQKRYRAINFDIASATLDKILPGGHRRAYQEIKQFFESHDFEHRQFSGYISKIALSTLDIRDLLEELGEKLPWLFGCVNKLGVTDVNRNTDMTYMFVKDEFEDIDEELLPESTP